MKHKLLITGLATATLLSTAALTNYSTNVFAEGDTVTKQDVADYFTDLEKQAEESINKNDKIKDKEVAILAAKAAIGKEDLLKAIDENQISPEDVLKDLAKASVSSESETTTSAPGAELVRNELGEVIDVKSENGGIPAEVQDKINKRLDEEKTDVKDAEERLAAAEFDAKEAESNREEAKATVELAKENLEAAKKELAEAKDSKSKEEAEKKLKQAEQDLKDAEEALKQAEEDYNSYATDRKIEEARVLKLKQEYKDELTSDNSKLVPKYTAPTPDYNEVKPAQTPAQAPATTQTPAAEVPATPGEATREEASPATTAAVAPKAEESKKEELPNTGTAELGLFTPAVLSILAGLGLVSPFGKKEDK